MHFYSKTDKGIEPRHFVPMAKDPSRTRASRVSDAKKALKEGEVWYPSVTTVLNVLDKPGLNTWRVDQHLSAAIDLIRSYAESGALEDITDYELTAAIKYNTQQKLDAAPKAGTDIHNVLESYIRDGVMPSDEIEQKICLGVKELLNKHCEGEVFECEKYFVNTIWGYAGCADLVSDNWVIDYKSKQEASKFKPGKMAYPEHVRQLAAYADSFDNNDGGARHIANIFICLETGELDFHFHESTKQYDAIGDFHDCLNIYNRNTYNPLENK